MTHQRATEPWRTLTTRRRFLRVLVGLAAAPLAGALVALGGARDRRERPRKIVVPAPTADGVTFHGDAIVVRAGGAVRALSSRCPHLGCRIGRVAGDELVCPCHGSRFNLAGKLVAGPAARDLRALEVEPSREQGKVDVVVRR